MAEKLLERDASGRPVTRFERAANALARKLAAERGGTVASHLPEAQQEITAENDGAFWEYMRLSSAFANGSPRGLEPAERQAYEFFTAESARLAAEPFTAGAKRGQAPAMTLESLAQTITAEKFGGDMSRYGDALSMAGSMRPDLLSAYLDSDAYADGQPPHSEPARDFTEQRREAVAGIVGRLTEREARAVLRLFVSKDLDNLVHKLADAGVSLAALDAVSAKQAKQVSPAVKVGYEGQAKDASGGY